MRIEENLRLHRLWKDSKGIVPITGTLAKGFFGLQYKDFNELAQEIDFIVHNGKSLYNK